MNRLKELGLTVKQARALALWHCEGWTQEQVGLMMGITPRAVRYLLSIAREKINKSGNSLFPRSGYEKRPKMIHFEEDSTFDEVNIRHWF